MSGPCWYCHHYSRLERGNAICVQGARVHVRAVPQTGCAFFEREPGADDDDWWPEGVSRDPFGDWMETMNTVRERSERLGRERRAREARKRDDDGEAAMALS